MFEPALGRPVAVCIGTRHSKVHRPREMNGHDCFPIGFLSVIKSPMAEAHHGTASSDATMSVGSQLCTQCGLCCTGVIHDHAALKPDEIEVFRALGMEVRQGEKPNFPLPCPQLMGTSCGIYRDRPHACAHYRCELLRGVEAGTVDPADALAKVREALRLYQSVLSLLPAGMTMPQARALPRSPKEAPSGIGGPGYPLVVLQVLALTRYIDRHFRHSDEGPLLREEVLTMGEPETPL